MNFESGAIGMPAYTSTQTDSAKTGISINSSGGTESRPNNITVKLWKRTA